MTSDFTLAVLHFECNSFRTVLQHVFYPQVSLKYMNVTWCYSCCILMYINTNVLILLFNLSHKAGAATLWILCVIYASKYYVMSGLLRVNNIRASS